MIVCDAVKLTTSKKQNKKKQNTQVKDRKKFNKLPPPDRTYKQPPTGSPAQCISETEGKLKPIIATAVPPRLRSTLGGLLN